MTSISDGLAKLTRRSFCLGAISMIGLLRHFCRSAIAEVPVGFSLLAKPLQELKHSDVKLLNCPQKQQFEQCIEVLKQLDADAMLKPLRQLAGLEAPGDSIGGWYEFNPNYDPSKAGSDGFAPGHAFGQWLSALARAYAAERDPSIRVKVQYLLEEFKKTISDGLFNDVRFPAYTFDKLLRGLLDVSKLAEFGSQAPAINKLTDVALPHLPPHAVPRLQEWNPKHAGDNSYTWDESYTLPENLYLAYLANCGEQYLTLAGRFLENKTFFEPLSNGQNALIGKHAYSYMNALSSAAAAFMFTGKTLYLRAALTGFDKVSEQSYATGGWGPDESFVNPEGDDLYASLSKTRHSFETPCGAYAHFKLCRYLLRLTGSGRYGDSMERVMYNTVLGALPLGIPGKAFYYMDNSFDAQKVYHPDACPCCAGTLPQVATDYGINTYFVSDDGIWTNLFIPSQVSWRHKNADVTLCQSGSYLQDGLVSLKIYTGSPVLLTLRFRVPGWLNVQPTSELNGTAVTLPLKDGFASLTRIWYSGDELSLKFDMPLRLEALDKLHPNVAAVMRGPLVLCALDATKSTFTSAELLGMKQIKDDEWSCSGSTGVTSFKPFAKIGSETYSVYVKLASTKPE